MLKNLAFTFLLTAFALLNGCTTLISTTTSEPIYVHPGKRTAGARIDDSQLEIIAKVNINKADEGLFNARVFVNSYNAVVLLTGQVATEELRQLAGETVGKINTVRQLHNELQVAPLVPLSTRTYDTWLTTKINSQMLATSDIPSSRVKVVTEAKTVFLMGILSRREADNVTEIARTTSGVRKVVRVFEYTD